MSWETFQQISSRGGERGRQETDKAQQQSDKEARKEETRVEELHSPEEGHPEKGLRRKRSDTVKEADGGDVAGISVTIQDSPHDKHISYIL